ncbi:MAG: hypothetical protein U5L00_18960 [Desulfovermiculus sp.]|nr:hypothetical protein [Desulfovermiculus sp.]
MAREEMALWNGKGQLQVRDARIWECGEQVMNIKAISGHMQVQDQDLEAFSALFPAAGEGIEALDADVFARQLFQKMLTASGNGQFSVSVSDLEAGADIDPESLHIGQLEIKGECRPPKNGPTNGTWT